MSIVSVKDFGLALNIPPGTIRSKISRKQLCCNKKGFIDTENPKNYIYLLEVNGGNQDVFIDYHVGVISKTNVSKKSIVANKNLLNVTLDANKNNSIENNTIISKKTENKKVNDSKALVKVVPAVETKIIPEKKVTERLSIDEKRKLSEQKKANDLLLSFEIRKKEAEVKVVERNAELKQYELEKKAGNSLPLDMIEKVVGINYKAIYKTNFSLANNVAIVIVSQLGGTKEDLYAIRKELENAFDKTVKDAEKKSSIDIGKMIDEYSEVRSRGERKI